MIVHDVAQNSADWWRLRLGMPTASAFDRILTKTGKPSAQAEGYMHQLLAEWLTGVPADDYTSRWMERGHELEDEAWRFYEMTRDADVTRGGFVTDDDGRVGCSPDGRIYDGGRLVGGIELKCPAPGTHMGYLIGGKTVADQYRHQVQGCLMITGADWWDVMSYHPLLPPAIVRVTPDEDPKYRDALRAAVYDFADRLDAARDALRAQGYAPRSEQEVAA